MFHRHNFELIDKTVMPSAFEQLEAAGQSLKRAAGITGEFFEKKVVLTFRCMKCGKLKIEER
jgi:hypothetical protein